MGHRSWENKRGGRDDPQKNIVSLRTETTGSQSWISQMPLGISEELRIKWRPYGQFRQPRGIGEEREGEQALSGSHAGKNP